MWISIKLFNTFRILEDEIPGTYVYNVQIGADCAQDQVSLSF